MNEKLVSANNLKYTYKDTENNAIDQQTFEIKKGEVIGLIGPNGAGKTTICLAIKGIIPHKLGGKWGGTLEVCGFEVSNSSISSLSQYVAMTFQNPETQIVGTTVEEDLVFLPENLSIEPITIRGRINHYMEIVRLPLSYKRRSPFTMSGGEKQRLAIASSLIAKPEIVILDEPTTELDPVGKHEVIRVVESVVDEGDSTFIIVEQDLDHLITITDRLFVIVNGKIVMQGKTRDVLSNAQYLEDNQINVPDVVKLWAKTPLSVDYPVFLTIKEATSAINEQVVSGRLSFKSLEHHSNEQTSSRNIIDFIQLSFSYNELKVLNEINLKISEGDFCAILGQNGAGKTTLVKHMNGLLKPTSGHLIIDGENTNNKSVAEMARKVSYVFQNPDHQIFAQTVEDEISFGPRNLGWDEQKIKDQVDYALKACYLEEYRNESPLSLERGIKQLLILASVISMDVDIFIVDEPTTGLSKKYKSIIGDVLQMLNNKGKTVILVTHDMHFVAKYAKSAVVIKDGKVALNGTVRDVFSKIEELRTAFVYPPQATLIAHNIKNNFNALPISIEEFILQMEWREIYE